MRVAGYRQRVLMVLFAIGALLASVVIWTTFGAASSEAQQANKKIVYGLTLNNRLVSFTPSNPGDFRTNVPITGLARGEKLVGIDFRPINRKFYAVSDESNIYTIKPNSGAATEVELGDDSAKLEGEVFGVDFNPMADALRIVSNTGQNLRVPFAPGADDRLVILEDTDLTYTEGPEGTPRVSGVAYRNNVPRATTTTLYYIDFARDNLSETDDANGGTLQVVGDLGIDTSSAIGFDIAPGFGGLAAFKVKGQKSGLYSVNLDNGKAARRGTLEQNLIDIAIQLTQKPAPQEDDTDMDEETTDN